MIYQGTSDLIWQPDLRVSTFPSGLVLAQRSASCRSTKGFRADLAVGDELPCEDSPAMDGLYIFPDTQETRTAAFTTYQVSAYGRTTDILNETYSDILLGSRALLTVNNVVTIRLTTLGKKCIISGVVPANSGIPVIFPRVAGSTVSIISEAPKPDFTTVLASGFIFAGSTVTNYGAWDEVILNYQTQVFE
jgi:hypothetical protein